MAETTGGGSSEVQRLELDISQFVTAIKQALAEYTTFTNATKTGFRVRLDPHSLGAITKNFQKLGQMLGNEFGTGISAVVLRLNELIAASRAAGAQAGKGLRDGIAAGTQAAALDLRNLSTRLQDQMAAFSQNAAKRVALLSPAARQRFGAQMGEVPTEGAPLDIYAPETFLMADKKGKAFLSSQYTNAYKRIIAALEEEDRIIRGLSRSHGVAAAAQKTVTALTQRRAAAEEGLLRASTSAYARPGADLARQRELNLREMAARAKRTREIELQAEIELRRRLLTQAGTQARGVAYLRTPAGPVAAAVAPPQTSAEIQKQTAALKAQQPHVERIRDAHKNIGVSILDAGFRLAKWLVFFRAIRDTMMVIERAISAVVRTGLEYAKAQEIQQIGLTGLLAENFKIVDAQGQQLKGMAAINAVTRESVVQWAKLQSASLAVVGTTEDLMLVYSSVLPFAARLGKTVEDVQAMTKAASIAAGALDISFQDVRSGLVTMLQGRVLIRNRLVAILGFERGDLDKLKGTPALFDTIMSRLNAFRLLSDKAQNTLGALAESFKDFIGVIGAQVMQPFIEGFKDMVRGLGQALFMNVKEGLTIKTEVKAFFQYVKSAATDVLEPLRRLGRELSGSSSGMKGWVSGLRAVLVPVSTFLTALLRAGLAAASFVAYNRLFLSGIVKWTVVAAAAMYVKFLGDRLAFLASKTGLLAQMLQPLYVLFGKTGTAATGTAVAYDTVTRASVAVTVTTRTLTGALGWLSAVVKTVLPLAVVGGIVTGLMLIIKHFARVKQEAKDTAAALDKIHRRDYWGVLSAAQTGLESSDLKTRRQNIARLELATSAQEREWQRISLAGVNIAEELAEDGANAVKVLDQLLTRRGQLEKSLRTDKTLSDSARDDKAKEINVIEEKQRAIRELTDSQEQFNTAFRAELQLERSRVETELTDLRTKARGAAEGSLMDKRTKIKELEAYWRELTSRLDATEYRIFDAERRRREIAARETLSLLPRDREEEEEPDRRFASEAEERIRRREEEIELQKTVYKAFYGQQLMTQDEFNEKSKMLDLGLFEFRKTVYEALIREYRKYWTARRAVEGPEGKGIPSATEMKEFETGVLAKIQSATTDWVGKLFGYSTQEFQRKREFAEDVDEWKNAFRQKIAELYGFIEDESGAVAEKMVADLVKALTKDRKLTSGEQTILDQLISEARAFYGEQRPEYKRYLRQEKDAEAIINSLRQQQELLNQSFDIGGISIDLYVQRLNELEQAQKAALITQREALQGQIAALRAADPSGLKIDQAALQGLLSKLAQVEAALANVGSAAILVGRTFKSWGEFASNLSEALSIFEGMSETLGKVGKGLSSFMSKMNSIINLAQSFRAFVADFKRLMGTGGGEGLRWTITEMTETAEEFAAKQADAAKRLQTSNEDLVDSAEDTAKSFEKLGNSIPIIGAAISAFAMAWQHAISKAKQAITKAIEDITKSHEEGTASLGKTVADLEAYRDKLQREIDAGIGGKGISGLLVSGLFWTGKSPADISAAKAAMEELDKAIEEMKKRVEEIRDAFDEAFQTLRAGTGPFGDFFKGLLEVQKFTKEYLDTFAQGTADWLLARSKVDQYYEIWLSQAKEGFREQILGFESQALGAQEQVFGLIEAQEDLYAQLAGLSEERAALQDQVNEKAEKEAEIRKRIADTIRQAAEDEAAIRRRGVLEAQLTVAEQKAIDIQNVRNKARDELDDLRDQLAKLMADQSLAKRAETIEKDDARLRQQIGLNEIRLGTAERIADIESAGIGRAMDRLDLARRQGEVEIRTAEIVAKRWEETKKLFDWIVQAGERFIFTPGIGFPEIRVDIGSITISNSSTTTNPGGGGGGNGGGGGFEEDERRRYARDLD